MSPQTKSRKTESIKIVALQHMRTNDNANARECKSCDDNVAANKVVQNRKRQATT